MGPVGETLNATQPLFTDIADSEANHYLFPEIQRVGDQYLLTYQTRDDNDNGDRDLFLQALQEDPNGDGLIRVGSPNLLLNQSDLSFHSDAFFSLDEQTAMLISTQRDNTIESELKRYVLNKDGDRLCLP